MELSLASWSSSASTQRKHRLKLHLQGQILLELGYRTLGGDFITLEYSFIDLGPKTHVQPQLANWFSNESDNIHQEMYDLSTKVRALGGSEVISFGRSS